ncbi:MAG TPA: EamA family transporter [Bryobacteraceae bacterium]|jgi:transporter family protein|nr:EamA family transporter [Bryobacteraceae bacterium]
MRWLLVLLIVCCNATGDLLDASGMKRHGEVCDFRPASILRLIRDLARNPFVLGGIAAMAVAFGAQMSLLSITDLSFAVPATASSYVLETVLAKVILGEHINRLRWIGAALVAAGVLLLQL